MGGIGKFFSGIKDKIFPPFVAPIPNYEPTRYIYADNPNLPTVAPTDTPIPTPTNTPMPTRRTVQPQPGMSRFNVEPYRVSGDFQLPQMPQYLQDLVWEMFPNEATKAAIMLGTENQGYDSNAYNYNKDGTGDYGMAQINSGTLADFLSRMPNQTRNTGVGSIEDLRDVIKNLKFAKLLRDKQSWNQWYGPGNRGFDIVGR